MLEPWLTVKVNMRNLKGGGNDGGQFRFTEDYDLGLPEVRRFLVAGHY